MAQKSGVAFLLVSLVVFVLDLFSKFLVVTHFSLYETIDILPIFNLTYVRNFGAAFSFLSDHSGWQAYFFIALAFVVSAILIYFLSKNTCQQKMQNIGYALVIGGALANAVDRSYRGYVVDFLDFHYQDWHYPVFNLADIAICIGAFLLIVDTVRSERKGK